MYRQHRAERESASLPEPNTVPTHVPAGPGADDGVEPPIEIDDSVDVPVKDDLSKDNGDLQTEVQLISYLGELPSPTDPAFDVFGTIMLPEDDAEQPDGPHPQPLSQSGRGE